MLEIKKISKLYETDGFKQKALNEVNVCFRKNEFVSILGPSGSGKTTLLNIIGGLDQYTSGDLVINEISTKSFKDNDWDTYRNHRVGFVFQSYNLIHHQSILANVELALTLSGIIKSERRTRAIKALKEVGLKDHMNKRPSQLSGGQMQRVAIARALVNDPDILLADEPTGALDSETSKQIMEILKNIAKEKLVIMVTHNSEIAKGYSTRIIKLKDGKIFDDSNYYDGNSDTKESDEDTNKKSKKRSMSFKTALSLSLNNLLTKKWRTILTASAGSIGIIGIALILSLSNGVNNYIERMEKETLSSYPLQIESNTMDFTSMIQNITKPEKSTCVSDKICTRDDISISPAIQLESAKASNNLEEFKKYLDNNDDKINQYITDIQYRYNIDLQIYSKNTDHIIKVHPNSFNLNPFMENQMEQMDVSGMNMDVREYSPNIFHELIGSNELLESQYTVLSGRLPNNYNELVLIVDENNSVPMSLIYSLNIKDRKEVNEILEKTKKGEKVEIKSLHYTNDDFIGLEYSLVLNTDVFVKEKGYWIDKSNDKFFMKDKINNGINLPIVGVIKISDDAIEASSGYVGYTHDLTKYVINEINGTEIAKEQLKNPEVDILTGLKFDGVINSYEKANKKLGIADLERPTGINIYPNGFESKENIEDIITDYNKIQEDNNIKENIISYTDYIGILLSSVTSAINIITYVLIAFVAVSLVVSSIMIAIITYISVLERTKEIGILRSIGASKKDISRVFRAETVIEGFVAGILGILITLLLCLPINKVINNALDVNNLASLPLLGGVSLIIISVLLNLIAGLIPAKIASKKDPVECIRAE
ncbi:MAG: ABC transporter ATP-binding protein/permease [Bacilli bacterium]|nr:ABC transporter ATP-binding protein/permease [Bacilli bacterium]